MENSAVRAEDKSSETSDLCVVYLGLREFPFGLAETQKVTLVAKGLLHAGAFVTVISRQWGSKEWPQAFSLPSTGVYEGIAYINTSGSLVRPDSWMRRRICKLRGAVGELLAIARLRCTGRLHVAILSTGDFWSVLYYRMLSLIFRFPILIHLVEYNTALRKGEGLKARLDAYLFDRFVYVLVDGLLPISEFLISNVQKYAPGKPWIQDPCLVDTARFRDLQRSPESTYLLFCGYLGYHEIIVFILDAFERLETREEVLLYLVVNGHHSRYERLMQVLGGLRRKSRIKVFSDLQDEELARLYVNAYALLIPLRPTVQDQARFPHKIGEYCASGRPVVTTNYGEVGKRFQHGVNAYVAPEYDVAAYASALGEALADPEAASRIGERGRRMAEEQFNYLLFGPRLRRFIETLIRVER